MKTLLLLFALFIPFKSQSATTSCEQLAKQLLPAMIANWTDEYYPLTCSNNIKKLSQRLLQEGQDLQSSRVLHLRHKWAPHYPVTPLAARLTYKENTYKPPRFMFHAVLIVEGLVLDLDFTEQPKIIGLKKYLAQMWSPEDFADYVFQTKSILEYEGKDLNGVFDEEEFPSQASSSIESHFSSEDCFNYEN